MNIRALSPSKIKAARLCLARLNARLTGDIEEESGEAARTGTLAHTAAKIWYRPTSFVQDPILTSKYRGVNSVATPDEAFKLALAELGSRKNPKTNVLDPELPATPSGVEDARCMFEAIITRYDRNICRVLFAERRYEGNLSNGVPVHLIVDLGIDRDNGILEIIDFKTGNIAMTTEEMWDEDQVLMNILAVRGDPDFQHYPMIQFTYYWARKAAETGPVSLTRERLADYEQWLFWEYSRLTAIQDAPETMNRFCGSCARRFDCSKYRDWVYEAFGLTAQLNEQQIKSIVDAGIMTDALARQVRVPLERAEFTPEYLRSITDDDMMFFFGKLKGQYDALERDRRAIGEVLEARMAATNSTELLGTRFKARMQQNKAESFSTSTVLKLASDRNVSPLDLISVREKNVKATFGADAKAMSDLHLTMRRSVASAFVAVNPITSPSRSNPNAKKASPRKKKADGQTTEAIDQSAMPTLPSGPTGPAV